MKKIFGLVLALVMILTASAVLADGAASPTGVDTTVQKAVTPVRAGIQVVLTDDNDETKEILKKITEAGAENALTVIPEKDRKDLPAEFTNVNEISTWKVVGDPTGIQKVEVRFTFTSPYKADDPVYLFLSVPKTAGGEWIMLQGKADAKGDILVDFDAEILKKLGGDPFVVIVVNKPEA